MKKPKPRYLSEEQIVGDIDRCLLRIAALTRWEAELDENPENFSYELQKKKVGASLAYQKGKLQTLKEKLSEFRTGLLPNAGVDDPSIPK